MFFFNNLLICFHTNTLLTIVKMNKQNTYELGRFPVLEQSNLKIHEMIMLVFDGVDQIVENSKIS